MNIEEFLLRGITIVLSVLGIMITTDVVRYLLSRKVGKTKIAEYVAIGLVVVGLVLHWTFTGDPDMNASPAPCKIFNGRK